MRAMEERNDSKINHLKYEEAEKVRKRMRLF